MILIADYISLKTTLVKRDEVVDRVLTKGTIHQKDTTINIYVLNFETQFHRKLHKPRYSNNGGFGAPLLYLGRPSKLIISHGNSEINYIIDQMELINLQNIPPSR